VTKIPAGVDFLIGHQLVKAIPRMYKSWNLDENWIPHHVWGVILGDYHRPIEFRLPNGNLGYYTGTTTPQKVNEIDYDRGFIVIEGGKVKREQIPGRDFFKLPVTAPEELDALKICPGEDITPVVVLEYDVETKGVHEAIRAYRQKNADKLIVIAKPMKEADEVTSGELPVAVEMRDVISDITSNPQVIEFVSTLLTNCNREILVGFRDRFGEMNIREEEQRV
jgi:hypothetical protein